MSGRAPTPLDEALRQALAETRPADAAPRAFRGARPSRFVRSAQRMRLPAGRDAAWAAAEYARWLPRGLRGLVRVVVDADGTCRFLLAALGLELLVLTPDSWHSAPDRQIYFIASGLLARAPQPGRFELRQLLDGRTLVTAIHDYDPRLPWPIYVASQALFHRAVMWAFRRHLRGQHSAVDPLLRRMTAAPTQTHETSLQP
jgi:hypothetical protein